MRTLDLATRFLLPRARSTARNCSSVSTRCSWLWPPVPSVRHPRRRNDQSYVRLVRWPRALRHTRLPLLSLKSYSALCENRGAGQLLAVNSKSLQENPDHRTPLKWAWEKCSILFYRRTHGHLQDQNEVPESARMVSARHLQPVAAIEDRCSSITWKLNYLIIKQFFALEAHDPEWFRLAGDKTLLDDPGTATGLGVLEVCTGRIEISVLQNDGTDLC